MREILNNYDKKRSQKAKLIALCTKAVTGVIGGSLVISNEHPYIAITVLAIGAVANEVITYIDGKNSSKQIES